MPILSVLLGESGKCPASSTMAPKPRGAVIGTLQAGAVFEADPLSSPPVPLSAMRRGGRSLLELFNISTDCELGPRFGPRSVPDALGGTQVALVGLRLDLSTGFDVAFFVALLVYASALKSASVYVGARWAGERPVGARNLAAALNCRGGPGIVLASLAYDAGIVSSAFYAMLVLLAVVTSIAAGSWLEADVRRGSALR